MTARGIALRCAYGAGVASVCVLVLSLPLIVRDAFPLPAELLALVWPAALAGFLVIAAPLLFLTVRPYWWGKIFVLWPAVSWMGFAAACTFVTGGWAPILFVPLGCGVAMLAIAVTHQVLDPRFSGAPLQ